MEKQILLYTDIYDYSAANFLQALFENKGNKMNVLVNTPGGDPYSTYGMIAVANQYDVNYEVHGQASSCGFYLVAAKGKEYATCLDVSAFVAHRASSWKEKYPDMMTDDMKAEIVAVNKNLRTIIENNLPDFEKVTGCTLDALFDMSVPGKVLNVKIDAIKAKKMGLVSKVIPITAKKKTEIIALSLKSGIAAFSSDTNIVLTENKNKMENTISSLAELRAAYPEFCGKLVAEGITAERERVTAALTYGAKYDMEATTKLIKEGGAITETFRAEMWDKAIAANTLKALEKGNAEVKTDPATATAKTDAEKMMEAANKELGWK